LRLIDLSFERFHTDRDFFRLYAQPHGWSTRIRLTMGAAQARFAAFNRFVVRLARDAVEAPGGRARRGHARTLRAAARTRAVEVSRGGGARGREDTIYWRWTGGARSRCPNHRRRIAREGAFLADNGDVLAI